MKLWNILLSILFWAGSTITGFVTFKPNAEQTDLPVMAFGKLPN
jgi:hypothetical protein